VSADVLEELGLAGLLHDVGYLDPAGASESFEERRRQHPVRGALRLAAMDGLPESVVLVAYEHHLRWDAAENYPRLSSPRRPGAPARVVAVADTWSTLRSNAGATTAEAAELLRDRAGTFLDPELVDRFLVGLV
jgi:HD-GYP domain-containing protein (c-di-GMP phosphodiesterase class II)